MNFMVEGKNVTGVLSDCPVVFGFALSSCKPTRVSGTVSDCG